MSNSTKIPKPAPYLILDTERGPLVLSKKDALHMAAVGRICKCNDCDCCKVFKALKG